jgi:molybdopterin-guanine dinucleotide biosynthesis protein MobB
MTTQSTTTAEGNDPSSTGAPESRQPVIISFVARSGTGKTTFLEKLLPELKAFGLRVGIVKHHAHATSFDVPGKDTYRLSQAGADVVVGVGSLQTAVFMPGDASDDLDGVILRHCSGLDLVLTEGYRRGDYPKVEIHRAARAASDGAPSQLLCGAEELVAVVTDERLSLPASVPQFELDDATGLAHYLVEHLHLAPVA